MEKLNYSDISNTPDNKIEIFNQTQKLKKFQELKIKQQKPKNEKIEPEKPKEKEKEKIEIK